MQPVSLKTSGWSVSRCKQPSQWVSGLSSRKQQPWVWIPACTQF
jgi:hypothetical protein